MTPGAKAVLTEKLTAHGQQHVLRFWDEISDRQRDALAAQVDSIDLDLLDSLVREGPLDVTGGGEIEPAHFIDAPRTEADALRWKRAEAAGLEGLEAGRVAAFVVAGGQGTRLGFDAPKGCYPIGPVTDRTLFRIHAEKVLAASRRAGGQIPFLVMTSWSNDAETREFFESRDFFGLARDSVKIFRQAEMPAVDEAGRLIMESPSRIFMSPNGHGGSLKALWDSGSIEWLEGRGVDVISYFQVDNPLANVVDAAFIGHHLLEGAEASLKVLRRTIPEEKLGIWALVEGRARVVEYIDMPEEKMYARAADGSLLYAGGSIAINCFSVPFVRRLNEKGFRLPFHFASKKVPFIDEHGQRIEPEKPNATKFETFVFDALLFTERAIAVETLREMEFSPVKNADGADSPETARRDMSRLYAKWLADAGVEVAADEKGYPPFYIEISPLYADDPGALAARNDLPKSVEKQIVLE